MDDLKSDKIVMFQKKHYLALSILMCFIIPGNELYNLAIVYNQYIGVNLFVAYLYAAIGYCILLNATWCVNSVCHLFGTRPWNSKILPAENYIVSIITLG